VGYDVQPSNGELARGIADLKAMVASLIGRAEYAAFQQGLEYRFSELTRLAEAERLARENDVKELTERLNNQAKTGAEHRMHWRSVILTGVLPALVTGLGILVTWIISHGGH
jgi:hypothetical protein